MIETIKSTVIIFILLISRLQTLWSLKHHKNCPYAFKNSNRVSFLRFLFSSQKVKFWEDHWGLSRIWEGHAGNMRVQLGPRRPKYRPRLSKWVQNGLWGKHDKDDRPMINQLQGVKTITNKIIKLLSI